MDKPPVSISASIAAFGVLGVTIERLPGEYRVNYRGGDRQAAQFADSLAEAIDTAGRMAAERPQKPQKTYARRGITKRAFVRRHNRKWGARFHREKRADAQRRALKVSPSAIINNKSTIQQTYN